MPIYSITIAIQFRTFTNLKGKPNKILYKNYVDSQKYQFVSYIH